VRTFKFSRDPRFVEKVRDVVGLYMDPPEKALVLCLDEKSQIQALDRTQPILPLRPSIPERQTHDYKRHGTTTLFAALNLIDGNVIAECQPRHRHQEFLRFLRRIDRAVSADLDIHIVLDNYGTHTHPEVKKWLDARPRYPLHFTPTSASWLNLVERFFAEITERRIRRGTFRSVPELENAVLDYVRTRNKNPNPFVWTVKASTLLRKVRRASLLFQKRHTSHAKFQEQVEKVIHGLCSDQLPANNRPYRGCDAVPVLGLANIKLFPIPVYDLYLLGMLSSAQVIALEEHLLICERCRDELDLATAFTLAMRRNGPGSDCQR